MLWLNLRSRGALDAPAQRDRARARSGTYINICSSKLDNALFRAYENGRILPRQAQDRYIMCRNTQDSRRFCVRVVGGVVKMGRGITCGGTRRSAC